MAALREPGSRFPPSRATGLGLRASILSLLAIGLMVVDHRQNHLQVIRQTLSAAAYPFQWLVHSPSAAGAWLSESFATRDQLRAQNAELLEQQRVLELRQLRLEALEQENVRLRAMTDASARVAERVMMAEVMRIDLDPLRQRLLVNRGTRDGAFKGQAVVDATGIVGQITRVGPFSAEVILISDSEHAIPVQVNRTGLRTIAVGTGEPRRLSLPYLPRNADVREGDLLLSSGLGGVFPSGYPVARISQVKRDPAQPLAQIDAEPAAALDRDRELLLIWFDASVPEPETPAPVPAGTGQAPQAAAPTPAASAAPAAPVAPATPGTRP